jgi:hypothetical protein
MPVYERGYTRWEHSGLQAYPPWWVIARRGITGPLAKRGMLLLIVAAWIPALVKGVMIFVRSRTGDLLDLVGGGWSSIDAGGFLSFLEWQRLLVFVILAIVGARLIAMDRRDGGLSLYFSRPLGVPEYVGGKLLIVLFYYLLVTLGPTLALCLFAFLVAPSATVLSLLVQIPLQCIVYCALSGAGMGLVLLAMSSLGERTVYVIVWWTILFIGSEAIASLVALSGIDAFDFLNFAGQYHNAGALVFGAEPRLDVPPVASLLVVTGYAAVSLWVLRRRIRPVEVVV